MQYRQILEREIIALSEADTFDGAKREWSLAEIYRSDDLTYCLCTHPIMECCVIGNHLNKTRTIVGNCCIKEFLGVDMALAFTGLRRIRESLTNAPNLDLISYCRRHNILSPREASFLTDTFRKRNLSFKQEEWRIALNKRIISRLVFEAGS